MHFRKQDMIAYCDRLRATVEIVKEEMKLGAGLIEIQEKEILGDWKNWGEHITCGK